MKQTKRNAAALSVVAGRNKERRRTRERKERSKRPVLNPEERARAEKYRAALNALQWVAVHEAKRNPMFPDWLRESVRFLVFKKAVACRACGKKGTTLWTMLCDFRAGNVEESQFVLKHYPAVFEPLTPVCDDHPLYPAVERDEKCEVI